MRKSLISSGTLRFITGRLLRSLLTLVLFQLVLFALIRTMTATLPYDLQDFAMAVQFQEDLSRFGASGSGEGEGTQEPAAGRGDDPEPQEDASAPEMPGLPGGVGVELGEPTPPPPTPEEEDSGEGAAPESSLDAERRKTPLPWVGELMSWMTAFYRGDFGTSTRVKAQPVGEILITRLPRTLLLLVPGTVGGFLLGMWLGKMVAWQPRGWLEFSATLGGTAFYTSFAPWLTFVMISVFGLSLNWFPPEKLINPNKWYMKDVPLNNVIGWVLLTLGAMGIAYLALMRLTRNFPHKKVRNWRWAGLAAIILAGMIPWYFSGLWVQVVDLMHHVVLPVITLILLAFGETMLIMKTTMSEAVKAEHVSAAKARGLPTVRVRDRHAARVAILPVLTRFVVHLPFVIIGSFVIEHLFFWDGMGQELIQAAIENDLPVLMGILSFVAIGILLAHTALDILTYVLDPRLRKGVPVQALSGEEG